MSNILDTMRLTDLCKPIVEYLKIYGDMYTTVHITMDEIKVTSVECSIPLIEEATSLND